MRVPKRIRQHGGRYALVDGIPFKLPISAEKSPAMMAAFSIDYEQAQRLLPGNELHPLRLWNKALLVLTVIDYQKTVIGKYIEFSVAIGCTRGARPAPRLLPAIFTKHFGTGQFVYDLPVSSEISVKGGKGIWGMPKHQANLNFIIGDHTVSSQYDLDGQLAIKIEIDRPQRMHGPISVGAASYTAFRGLLMKSDLYFKGRVGFRLRKKGAARLFIGDHPRVQPLKALDINPNPLFIAFLPEANGILDDHFEGWFLSYAQPLGRKMEGMESVVNLGLSEAWLSPPTAQVDVAEYIPVRK
jgi:hypothetical protein